MNLPTQISEVKLRNWGRPRVLLYLGLAGLLAVLGVRIAHITVAGNFHAVVPGRVYRCAQLAPAELERAINRHGIRTIVNLRGIGFGMDWYLDECRVTHRLGVSQEDVWLSAGRLPSVSELRNLVDVLDHSEYPILIHCKQGIDRTGLASALVLLLCTDAGVNSARGELGLHHGHVPLGRTAYMGRFFDLYEDWLAEQGREHSPGLFRRWLQHECSPGPALARLELLAMPSHPPLGRPWPMRVRAGNISAHPWNFWPGSNAGVHCAYLLIDEQGNCLKKERAGLFVADVPPGQSIDLTVAVPAIHRPGTYYLYLDMLDEQQQSLFYQHGSEPLVCEFVLGP